MNPFLKRCFANLFFGLLGARRCLSKSALSQMALTGLSRDDIVEVSDSIRSVAGWRRVWEQSGRESYEKAAGARTSLEESRALYRRASACFYMAQVFLDFNDPEGMKLIDGAADAFERYAKTLGDRFEAHTVSSAGHEVRVHLFHPRTGGAPPPLTIMVPSLGSSKEHIYFMVEPFFDAGVACLTVDLPGVGRTKGAMPLDSQKIFQGVIDWLNTRGDWDHERLAMMGMSLGAYWTMKTAAEDSRVKVAMGISTPAISGNHWDELPSHYWDYFARVFATPDFPSTRRVAQQLSLFDVMDRIHCPVLLFHGGRDRVSQPDAMELFYRETRHAPLTVQTYPELGHCCLEQLIDDVMPRSLTWFNERLGLPLSV